MHRIISIHASRGGSDPFAIAPGQTLFVFQSTLPAGEATKLTFIPTLPKRYFNPRFPRGKRLEIEAEDEHDAAISIHASRGGSDDICL